MSIVADFAQTLHENRLKPSARQLRPAQFAVACEERLADIRAVVFDVYGTMINYWKEPFADQERKERSLLDAFKKSIDRFKLTDALMRMNPDAPPERTLYDLYHGLISLKHGLASEKKERWPEIKIEQVWETIVLMCKRHGYDSAGQKLGSDSDLSFCMAYHYNFFAINRELYPGVYQALKALKQNNIMLGILSNAQFYTPIDLTLLLRDQSGGACEDYGELFEPDLVFYSYQYGVAKPDTMLFTKLFDALYEFQVLPSQTVFAGNDVENDILPARAIGLKTALFIGDDRSLFIHDASEIAVSELVFKQWETLPDLLSFHGGK